MAYYSKRRSYRRRYSSYKSRPKMAYKKRSYKRSPYSSKLSCSCHKPYRKKQPLGALERAGNKVLYCAKRSGVDNISCQNDLKDYYFKKEGFEKRMGIRVDKADAGFKKKQTRRWEKTSAASAAAANPAVNAAGAGGIAPPPSLDAFINNRRPMSLDEII